MLDLSDVDLGLLCEALEDHSYEHQWWLDPETGQVEFQSDYAPDEEGDLDPEERGFVHIDSLLSHDSYRDLEDFVALVRDPRAHEMLVRAIQGRGAFRRFKDTLFEFPALRTAWFTFHDARMERRALEWLDSKGLIDPDLIERELQRREDPDLPELSGAFDPFEVAAAVVRDLRGLYGDRLEQVLLFGSWARGEGTVDSDIDLLVVLDRVESRWEELRRMDSVLWHHSYGNDAAITAIPVAKGELAEPKTPALIRACAEGQPIE